MDGSKGSLNITIGVTGRINQSSNYETLYFSTGMRYDTYVNIKSTYFSNVSYVSGKHYISINGAEITLDSFYQR